MPLLAVLFDLDDTLHDKSATLDLMAKKQFREFNLARSVVDARDWVEQFVALNNQRIEKAEVFARLGTAFNLPESTINALLADFDARLGALACPCAGALKVLTTLKENGLKLGVVTNGRDAFQRSKLEGMGMTHFFDSVITSGALGRKKPDPSIFIACLAELGVSATNAAFVGDDFDADMQPSIALGMLSIWKTSQQSNLVSYCSNELTKVGQYLLNAN